MQVYHQTYGQGTLIQHNANGTSTVQFGTATIDVPTAQLSDVIHG